MTKRKLLLLSGLWHRYRGLLEKRSFVFDSRRPWMHLVEKTYGDFSQNEEEEIQKEIEVVGKKIDELIESAGLQKDVIEMLF